MEVVTLRGNDFWWAQEHARRLTAALRGGKSQFRGAARASTVEEDDLVGQCGEAALSYVLTGSIKLYRLTREYMNRTPKLGGRPYDLLGLKVDVKTSLWRYPTKDPKRHVLAVRPKERHDEWAYVLGLCKLRKQEAEVTLVGWCRDVDLPLGADVMGVFEGAYTKLGLLLDPDFAKLCDFALECFSDEALREAFRKEL